MFRYRVITTVICHLIFVAISHLYYRYCIGGSSWWSLLVSFNAHSNAICSTVKYIADVFSMAVHSAIIAWIMEIPRLFITFRRIRET